MSVSVLGLDTETSGLRPYHGDRPFALTLYAPGLGACYANFHCGGPRESWLDSHTFSRFQTLFGDPSKTWRGHNIKFDSYDMLAQRGFEIKGTVHCTKSIARVEFNEWPTYDLASCARRIGYEKDEAVENYIESHKLWDWETIPGKKARKKNLHYDAVPFDLIVPSCRERCGDYLRARPAPV